MKVQKNSNFENFQLIQNNPYDATRHLNLHKRCIDSDSCEAKKIRFIEML